jgi:DNA-binding beta-propeller fold protein YncE
VTSANPNSAAQGTVNLNVSVGGKGFKAGAKAKWFVSGTNNPGGVTVNSTSFVNSNTLTANITVSSTATVGNFDIVVTNTDGRTGKGGELFSVQTPPGQCTDVPLRLIVVPQAPGQGGISGDGLSIYNNPSDAAFNGGTLYQDGVGGVYVRFQLCNGTNDFVLNLRGTSSPVRYLNLDFSVQLASPDTADGAVDLTGQQLHQQGEQINEMATGALTQAPPAITLPCIPHDLTADPSGSWIGLTCEGTSGREIVGLVRDPATGAVGMPAGVPSGGDNPQGIRVTPDGKFVVVVNQGTSNVSVFSLDASTGALTAVPGSPFPAGSEPAPGAIDPSGKFVFVGDTGGNSLSAYTMDSAGSLTSVTGTPVPLGTNAQPSSTAVEPAGKFVFVSIVPREVAGFAVDPSTGALTPIAGSPFPVGAVTRDMVFVP